jgi:hypothetical protein
MNCGMPRNVASHIVVFWRNYVHPRGLAAAVKVKANGETIVKIEDSIPPTPFRRRGRGWRITSVTQFLRSDHFPEDTPRKGVLHNDEKARGRTLYCVSQIDTHSPAEPRRGQVAAALSFHVDDRKQAPLLITNLAIRGDSDEARALSRAAAAWMLAYLIEASVQLNRGDEIGVEIATQPNSDDFSEIGFRATPTPKNYDSPYWSFRAPV